MSEELKEKILPLLKEYDNMCFCGDPACLNYQVTLELRDQLLELFEQYAKEREVRARKYELNWAIEYHRGKPNPPLAREYFRKRLAQLEPSADDKPKAKPFTAEELKPKGWTDDRFA